MDIKDIAGNLSKKNNGIFFSQKNSTVSYPEQGNSDLFQIEDDSFWFNHRNNLIIKAVKK